MTTKHLQGSSRKRKLSEDGAGPPAQKVNGHVASNEDDVSPDESDGSPAPDTERHLQEAIDHLASLNSRAKVRGNIRLQIALETIEKVATETGLSADDIIRLMNILTRGHLAETPAIKLVKHLIPSTVVPSRAVCVAVSWMCTNEPSSKLQAIMVRWMVLIYETIDDPEEIHALYGILFYFIQNEVMCPHVCHLLYLMTRKEDVRLFRVHRLIKLQKKMGSQPYLQGLLSIYRVYCPRFIILERASKVFFRQTDRAWFTRVRAVLDRRRVDRSLDNLHTSLLSQQVVSRVNRELIPGMQASSLSSPGHAHDTWSVVTSAGQPIPFAQITSFKLLLQNFDRLELPSQMAVALKNRNLQYVLMCYPEPTIAVRFAYWLDHVLCEEFLINPSKDRTRAEELLKTLIVFSEFLKESVPVCENFLVQYLHIWNGSDFRALILKLITRFRLCQYQILNDLVLEPLRKLFFCSSVYFKCQVVKTLTMLLYNLVAVELPRYRYCRRWQQAQSDLRNSSEETANNHCVFVEEVEDLNAEDTIMKYIEYVNTLVDVGILLEDESPLFMHCILNFYQVACNLHKEFNLPFIVLPRRTVIYYALFASDSTALARICQILCRYRDNFVLLRNVKTKSLPEAGAHYRSESLNNIRSLNSYILDYCDSLWRQRAFTSKETDTVYNLIPRDIIQGISPDNFTQLYSLYKHPALLGFGIRFMDKNFDATLSREPALIKQCRDQFLEFLGRDNMPGIIEFISKNINRRSSTSSSQLQNASSDVAFHAS